MLKRIGAMVLAVGIAAFLIFLKLAVAPSGLGVGDSMRDTVCVLLPLVATLPALGLCLLFLWPAESDSPVFQVKFSATALAMSTAWSLAALSPAAQRVYEVVPEVFAGMFAAWFAVASWLGTRRVETMS